VAPRYIKGEKPPTTGAMFLGSRVDDALSAYYRQIIDQRDQFALDPVLDIYRELWATELAGESQGVDWEAELTPSLAFELGREAIELAMLELVPYLGDPVEVQRRLEFTIAPGLEWTVLCYLDLETLKEDFDGQCSPGVVDFKVKNSLIGKEQADADPQAGLYLAGRWLEGNPASAVLRADRQTRKTTQADGRLARPDEPNNRPAARCARQARAGSQPDRRVP
jgi:hypothetical protein